MRKFILLFVAAACCYVGAAAQQPSCASHDGKFVINNGVNIAHWLSQSRVRGETRASFFTENDIVQIASWGFDHIRIPIDEEQMFHEDGTKDAESFQLLHNALDLCLKHNLRAVVDLHILRSHYFNADVKPLFTEESAQNAFYECWRQISGELRGYSNSMVAYELMNEPVADDPADWNKIVRECHAVIRSLETERVLVIGSNRWQSFDTAEQLDIPKDDPNIILSFHYYNPMILTHYQAGWTEFRDFGGVVHYPGRTVLEDELALRPQAEQDAFAHWTGEVYDKGRLEAEFRMVLDVAARYGISVYCGEYGCLAVDANSQDRYAWLRHMNEVFGSLGIARAVWCYREGHGGFGILSAPSEQPDLKMLQSILQQ